jgi:hypothetical protein
VTIIKKLHDFNKLDASCKNSIDRDAVDVTKGVYGRYLELSEATFHLHFKDISCIFL